MAGTEQRMNLVAIQRSDPYAKEIVDSSAHVAFYSFNIAASEWEKTDIEGTLFIYSRNAEPYHSIFINNRLNTNSLVEPINGQIELQWQPPFILYRNKRSRIRGFWFYNNSECDRIREIIAKLVAECNSDTKKGIERKVQTNGNTTGTAVDIFTMLTKAQEDFNNSSAKQQPASVQPEQTASRSVSEAINIVPDPTTPQSVVNFFAAAKQPAASEVPLFQSLMSNPAHTVEQIEKQHRATTPQKDSAATGKVTPDVSELENNFKLMGIPMSTGTVQSQELGTSPLATFLSSTNLAAVRNNNQPIPKTKPIEISELESRQQQHPQPLHELLKKSETLSNPLNNIIAAPPISGGGSGSKPALMPPTMFASTSTLAPKGLNDIFASAASKKQQEKNSNGNSTTTVTDLLSKTNQPLGLFPIVGAVEPLTQSQLIQAISYLIKHDPDFVRKLHEAYLKSFQEMMAL